MYKPVILPQEKKKGFLWRSTAYSSETTRIVALVPLSSTTSSVSSSGACSAIAKIELERKLFIANTTDELRIEAAEGSGEHLVALATLCGCRENLKPHFSEIMKNRYQSIFATPLNQDVNDLHDHILDVVEGDRELSLGCSAERI